MLSFAIQNIGKTIEPNRQTEAMVAHKSNIAFDFFILPTKNLFAMTLAGIIPAIAGQKPPI